MKPWIFLYALICLLISQLTLTGSVQAQSPNSREANSSQLEMEVVPIPLAREQKTNSEAGNIQESVSPSMEERSLETHGVLKIPDPTFITEGTSIRTLGIYFGFGFRQVRLDFREGLSILDNDSVRNGVAFNLGYFTETLNLEYTRHVTILDLQEVLTLQDVSFNAVEVIQNNFWYFRVLRLNPDLYLRYGIGVQTSEVRLIANASTNSVDRSSISNDSSMLYQEGSLIFGGGVSFFLTSNFFIQYRYTYGIYSPLITSPNVNNALQSSQYHTIFFQYYFPL